MSKYLSYYIIIAFITMSICGAFMPENLYADGHINERLSGISVEHLLGTDLFGRDIFLRIVRGAYNVAIIALPSVVIGLCFGGMLGIITAQKNTIFRTVVGGVMDIVFAFPIVLLALAIVTTKGSHPLVATITLSVFFIPVFYRVLHMRAMELYTMEYITSARLSGLSNIRIVWKHIVPNILPIATTQASIQIAMAILAEAGLGYLGLSVQPPDPTWGSLLLDGQNLIFINPWVIVPIGFIIIMTVWAFVNMSDKIGENSGHNVR